MRIAIYNLEFPSWCKEFTVKDHKFYRVKNYEEQINKLQHFGEIRSEIKIRPNSGENAITAFVDVPPKREKIQHGVMLFEHPTLDGILFLLSLFTGREVFTFHEDYPSPKNFIIQYDPRLAPFGGILKTSIPYKIEKISTLRFKEINFEKTLNQIYEKINEKEWIKRYDGGHFLRLAKQAFRAQTYESAYVQSWTIWEHLFALHNRSWLSDEATRQLNLQDKISFILKEYFLKDGELDFKSKKRIKDLSEIRNRLIHFGKFPEKRELPDLLEDVLFFIQLTEQLVAKTLGLGPSNIFNTVEKLEKFLKGQPVVDRGKILKA